MNRSCSPGKPPLNAALDWKVPVTLNPAQTLVALTDGGLGTDDGQPDQLLDQQRLPYPALSGCGRPDGCFAAIRAREELLAR